MDKFRKIGIWLWLNKERMVLVIVVAVLCYHVYRVFNPKPPPPLNVVQPPQPGTPKPEDVGVPPLDAKPPEPQAPENWTSLQARNPFWYYGRTEPLETGRDETGDAGIRLLRIRTMPDGRAMAQLETNLRKWYYEGDKFESFELLRIDPDMGTCEVYSNKQDKTITLTLPEAEKPPG